MIKTKVKVKIHFIGIGGIGMSALANILLSLGYEVSGSDSSESSITKDLEARGASIFLGHLASNVIDQTAVIYSSAIKSNNPEMIAAKEKKIPVYRRAELLADLMMLKYSIAVAGTHGKTTTTSILATIFTEAELDPTFIIGGVVRNLGVHARVGKGEHLIAESDESDGTFLLLRPVCSIVTNIDSDHLDFYKSIEDIKRAFLDFINLTPFFGVSVLNLKDKNVRDILPQVQVPVLSYALEPLESEARKANYLGKILTENGSLKFSVEKNGKAFGDFELMIKGRHNVENAMSAIAIADFCEIPVEKIQKGIKAFIGAGRRMETVYKATHFELLDDYAHHPTEIKAVVSALGDKRKTTIIFEPHRYSRMNELWGEFLDSLTCEHEVFILPIYAASESPIEGINSSSLVKDLCSRGVKAKEFHSTEEFTNYIKLKIKDEKDELIACLGAGRISKDLRASIGAAK
jgi:UDP-N-acetylmuramate--alanine ligase